MSLGFVPACGGGEEDGTPSPMGSGATSGSGSGGSSAGTAGTGGTAGSSGTESGGTGGQMAGSGGSSSGAGGSGGTESGGTGGGGTGGGGTGGGNGLTCFDTEVGCMCSPLNGGEQEIPLCTAASVNGLCCSEPGTGFCSCRSWSCENDSLGCSCGAGVEDGPLTQCNGVYGVCCLSQIGTASSCYCDDILTECVGENDMEVANCGIDIAPCAVGETPVDACKE
ncbi:MAG TPA: hypothetical protein VM686_16020 [Polyangiaceae bacterium]|nr:hypothetical protein [Polyangiaceae bacterium]